MKLLVISHTEHYHSDNGSIVGWGPTVRELDELTEIFEQIIHVACLYPEPAPPSAVAYTSGRVTFISIPPYGGPGWLNKLKIISLAPIIIYTVFKALRQADVFQFRAPTSMGVYLIPLLSFFGKKPGWFKYAGNWIQESPPLSYAIQRWCLAHLQRRKVTINGKWPGQKTHFLSFENPCFNKHEIEKAAQIALQKSYSGKFKICFVGNLKDFKGILNLLEGIALMPEIGHFIEELIIAGDGPLRPVLEEMALRLPIPVSFCGFLNRQQLEKVYAQSHFICLPSKSEGFPKVIAEGSAFGCIPVVTNVSSIGQYVKHGDNGFLLANNSPAQIAFIFKTILNKMGELPVIAKQAQEMATLFTYERYRFRILNEIIT